MTRPPLEQMEMFHVVGLDGKTIWRGYLPAGSLVVVQAAAAPAPLERADHVRMGKQRAAVWALVRLGEWWTLAEVSEATGAPEASVSARLRDFRRPRYGGHTVERRKRGREQYEYRVAGAAPPPT